MNDPGTGARELDAPRTADSWSVHCRPTTSTDSADLSEFLRRLSPETARQRFRVPLPRLSASALAGMVRHDHARCAWVAVGGGRIVGHVMLARASDVPGAPLELAMVVADAWQGRGIGHRLVACAVTWAQTHDEPVITAFVAQDNRRLLSSVRREWSTSRISYEDREVAITAGVKQVRTTRMSAPATCTTSTMRPEPHADRGPTEEVGRQAGRHDVEAGPSTR